MNIGYTTGVFDLFHIGHLNILRNAKKHCDYLIVGITTDELTEELKGRKPIVSYVERAEIVKHIEFVDDVVPQKKIDELGDWNEHKFKKIFKGSDWKNSKKWNQLEAEFKKRDVEVVFFDYTQSTSSSLIREVLYNNVDRYI